MTAFQVEDVDEDLANRIRARAKRQGMPVRRYFRQLAEKDLESEPLEDWLEGRTLIAADKPVDVEALRHEARREAR